MVWLVSPQRGNDAAREQAVRLRPTTSGDLPNILAMEADPDASRFIVRWSRERHVQAIAAPDEAHLTVLDGDAVVGFVLLAGLTNEHDSIELRRIVVDPPGRGIGRRAISAVLEEAFLDSVPTACGSTSNWTTTAPDAHTRPAASSSRASSARRS